MANQQDSFCVKAQIVRFKVISAITNIQVIAKGTGVDIRQHLNRTYAGGRKVH
jgi:hypothetical protein